MKFRKLIPLFLMIISVNLLFSQVKFSAGPTLGFTGPVGDYSGTTMDFYNGTRYGLKSGLNFGAVFKVKFIAVNAKLSLIYTSLNNTGTAEPGKGSIDTKQNILTIGIGPEFYFSIPGSPVKPYAEADLLFTSFSGETSFLGAPKVPSDGTFSMSSASRTGLGLGAGVNFGIGKSYSLDLSLRYNFHNLFGKSFSGGDKRIYSYTSLNDDKDPVYPDDIDKHPIGNSRSISTIMINFAFLFDF